MERPYVMLTFDLEEFDIPEEFGQKVPEMEQMRVSLQGMENVRSVLDKHDILATFFTTGNFAEKNPLLIRALAEKHEIASHALYHSPTHIFTEEDIAASRSILESVSGKTISGFRMPRLKQFDRKVLSGMGFRYDSSINPTWLPGRYNLLGENPLPNKYDGIIELPCATTPWFRFPLFWLSFKNLPLPLYASLCKLTLRKRGNLMLYFHPWEFADLSAYKLPSYIKSVDNEKLAYRLDELIKSLKTRRAHFVTCNMFCEQWEKSQTALGKVG